MNTPFSTNQLKKLKQQLSEKQNELHTQLQQSLHFSADNTTSELSHYDNHIADQATELYNQELDISLNDHLLTQLEEVEAAIDRLSDDNFGYCIACHQPISFARLEAAPEAQYCVEHQPQHTNGSHYIDAQNEMANTTFEKEDATYFDGEDTTQALYQFGTSGISQYQNYNYEFAEEFDDCFQNGVEALEDFVATDITGKNVYIIRNEAYRNYVAENDTL